MPASCRAGARPPSGSDRRSTTRRQESRAHPALTYARRRPSYRPKHAAWRWLKGARAPRPAHRHCTVAELIRASLAQRSSRRLSPKCTLHSGRARVAKASLRAAAFRPTSAPETSLLERAFRQPPYATQTVAVACSRHGSSSDFQMCSVVSCLRPESFYHTELLCLRPRVASQPLSLLSAFSSAPQTPFPPIGLNCGSQPQTSCSHFSSETIISR